MATTRYLPLFVYGKVIKGFGRGSKELGIPTANLSEETIDKLPDELRPGIYYGFASVDHGAVHKMVLSVGWNPFYNNKKKSMETHILHKFGEDFYGSLLQVVLLGFVRPEQNFSSLDDLIVAIKNDISVSESKLEEPSFKHFSSHSFWQLKSKEDSGVFSREFSTTSDQEGEKLTNGEVVK